MDLKEALQKTKDRIILETAGLLLSNQKLISALLYNRITVLEAQRDELLEALIQIKENIPAKPKLPLSHIIKDLAEKAINKRWQ